MNHLTAAECRALSEQLDAMKRRTLDEIRSVRSDVKANLQPQNHEVQDRDGEAEAERASDVRLAEIEIDRNTLDEIERAQQRMAERRYGLCQDCGEPIALARLRVQPTAIRCAVCQAAEEQRHHRLGAP